MIPKKIKEKILAGQRLERSEALEIYSSENIFDIARLANKVAIRYNDNKVYFILNRHINPTNICINRCKFCAFSRSKGQEGAYELTIDEIINKIKEDSIKFNIPIREVHIVGGLHPQWQFDYYLRMLKEIKNNFPHIAIKAFTAVEIDYMSKISGLDIVETLSALKKNGLDILPGGGAEIFAEKIRQQLCPEKIKGERWLEIMEIAHNLGIKTNASMLYGHVESIEDRVDHLIRLRDLQDKTNGFQAFIPLAYHPKNNQMGGYYTSAIEDLKTIALSRLVLDNFPHIKAYWVMLGQKISQIALLFGADDIDGTVIEEKITHLAGSTSPQIMHKDILINIIKKTGKRPVERDAFYNIIEEIS
ncbi:MAG: aminofutalosine synthase MqnE [Thermodesulfovibrionales bacterium]|nr:aminofutalosine synthase MqnE [Thermodesulfovibrionales bacterium]